MTAMLSFATLALGIASLGQSLVLLIVVRMQLQVLRTLRLQHRRLGTSLGFEDEDDQP